MQSVGAGEGVGTGVGVGVGTGVGVGVGVGFLVSLLAGGGFAQLYFLSVLGIMTGTGDEKPRLN